MSKAKFTLMDREMDPAIINGRMSAFGRVPYGLAIRSSKAVDESRYGVAMVDGIPISQGVTFENDLIIHMFGLLLPVGEVARDFGSAHTLKLTGFYAKDGTPFADATLTFKTAKKRMADPAFKAHDEVALQAAREGMVLLKNEASVLPLKGNETLNCFGPGAYMYRVSANGAGLINPRWQPDFPEAVREHSGFALNEDTLAPYRRLQTAAPDAETLRAAREKSDTALIFITRDSGEFLDNKPAKGWYYLTDGERAMIGAVTKAFPKTVLILNTGYPIEMGFIEEYGIQAALYTGFAGMLSAWALVEILDGRVNPSGKLPDTFALDYWDHPSSRNFINFKAEDRLPGEKDYGVRLVYEEGIYVGYRFFDTFQKPVAYGFGHGLSYTEFAWQAGEVARDDLELTLPVTVTNTGGRPGQEAMQLYVAPPGGRLEKASRVLAAFEKTCLLEPGGQESMLLKATLADAASFDEARHAYVLEAGEYELHLGRSLAEAQSVGAVRLDKERIVHAVQPVARATEAFHRMSRDDETIRGSSETVPLHEEIKAAATPRPWQPQPLQKTKAGKISFDALVKDETLLDDFVTQMNDAELCRLNVCGGADWYMPWQTGAAGKTPKMRKYGLPRVMASDGNTGLNIKKHNVGFPSSATVCATFNKRLAEQIGSVIGTESLANGIALNLGPGMNIHRNPLNGRHPEYFSEDPYLAGMMAGHHARGLEKAGCGATYKHLFCNNSDTSRKGSHSIVPEQALREIYFKAFEVALRVQTPTALMTSYNSLNGIHPACNPEILEGLIRNEWRYEGFVMTDWGTYDTIDPVSMAAAGVSWLTEGGGKYVKALRKALKKGKITRAQLEHNARWLMKSLVRLSKMGGNNR